MHDAAIREMSIGDEQSKIRHKNFQILYVYFVDQRPHLPQRGMLKLFAEHERLSDRYFSHIKYNRKDIQSTVSRKIESGLKLLLG